MADGHLPAELSSSRYGSDSLIDDTADWLMGQALAEADIEFLFAGCCSRLSAAGIPLSRAHLAYRTLHPLFTSKGITWRPGVAIEHESHAYGTDETDEWRNSPFYFMTESDIPTLRRRLRGADAIIDYPLLETLAAEGASDYLAHIVPYGNSASGAPDNGILASWSTNRPSGFSDNNIRSILRIQRRLAVACKVAIEKQITHNILMTYMGVDAGNQIINGRIRRGDGETIHAIIFYCDLRQSTRLADVMEAGDYLALLNQYFECSAGAVLDAGGEVLDFIGDAVLAIFRCPADEAPARAFCANSLDAAQDALARIGALNKTRASAGLEAIDVGIGLHVGDVLFGNIGVPERLSFSVIGPAANEVARLESLTKELDRSLLVSGAFARLLEADWEPLGTHMLRGVGNPVEAFSLPGL